MDTHVSMRDWRKYRVLWSETFFKYFYILKVQGPFRSAAVSRVTACNKDIFNFLWHPIRRHSCALIVSHRNGKINIFRERLPKEGTSRNANPKFVSLFRITRDSMKNFYELEENSGKFDEFMADSLQPKRRTALGCVSLFTNFTTAILDKLFMVQPTAHLTPLETTFHAFLKSGRAFALFN